VRDGLDLAITMALYLPKLTLGAKLAIGSLMELVGFPKTFQIIIK